MDLNASVDIVQNTSGTDSIMYLNLHETNI